MEKLLQEARQRGSYYKEIAKEAGRKRLRDIYNLSRLIEEHKEIEKALSESEERYRRVVEDMPAMICRFFFDGTLTFVNKAYCQYFNKKKAELMGSNFFAFIPDSDQENVKKHFMSLSSENPMITYEHQVIAPDGALRWQEWTDRAIFNNHGRLVEFQSIGRDITERKQALEDKALLEKRLHHAQRMKSLGALAGTIAHDFNNMLTGINGHASLMLMDMDSVHPHFNNLKRIENIIKNANDMTKRLISFTKSEDIKLAPADLNELCEQYFEMFVSLHKDIKVHREYKEDLWRAEVDSGQIGQVLLNLYMNARQAMPEGGELIITTENILLGDNFVKPYNLQPGRFIKISLADTGTGMAEDVLQSVFEPFFTTKEEAGGMGIGLASAYGVISNHNGIINVSSKKGFGTTFNIFLPVIDEKRGVES